MSVRISSMLTLSLFLAFMAASSTFAADGGGGGGGKGRGNPITFILSKATDLNLTDDEKTKLQALEKDAAPVPGADRDTAMAARKAMNEKINAILTPDQQEKLKALRPKRGGGGGANGGTPPTPPPAN